MNYRIFLLLGSNEGIPLQNLSLAADRIAGQAGPIIARSAIYRTAPWGKSDQPDFYNQALEITSSMTPRALLKTLLEIECEMGRVRLERWGPRIIDIDILLFGDLILNEPDLVVPHPGLPFRRFALLPLADLAPDFIHPALKKSVRQLLDESPDTLMATRI